jgi:hypothetical protein
MIGFGPSVGKLPFETVPRLAAPESRADPAWKSPTMTKTAAPQRTAYAAEEVQVALEV